MWYEALEVPSPKRNGSFSKVVGCIAWCINAKNLYLIQRVTPEERRGVAYLAANTKEGAEHKARKHL